MRFHLRPPATLVALGLLAAPDLRAQPVLVKFATPVAENSSWHLILKESAEQWKTLSAGKVTVRLYAGGVAGEDRDVVRKLGQGVLNAGMLSAIGLAELDKSVYALGVPMMYASYDEVYWVLEKMRPRFEASLDAKGFVVLSWADGGWVHFFAQRPVATPDQLKPLKMFTWAGDNETLEMWRSGGFNPVPLSATELARALQTGLVAALGVTPRVAVNSQHYMNARNMTDLDWQLLLMATVIRKDVWQTIPAELRPALLEAARAAGMRLRNDARGSAAREVEAMRKRGLNVVAVDDKATLLWNRTAESLYPMIRGKIVPADAFDEALRWRSEFRKGR